MSDTEFVRKDIHDKDMDIIAAELDNQNRRIDDIKDSYLGRWQFWE